MKKISLIIIGFIVIFVGAYVVYQNNIEDPKEELAMISDVSVEEDISSVDKQASESEQSEVLESDDVEDDDSDEIEEPSSTVWRGPSTTYLDAEDNVYRLLDNAGEPMIINIWASWCPPCRDEMPLFEQAYQEYGEDITFLMLNALESRPSETKEVALNYVESIDLSMPVYFDNKFANQIEFSASTLPLTAVLDADGEVVEIVRGQVSPAKLKQMINKVL
ncbi:TlpA family protein disulfide reductase [Aerococcaceae bacterium WGS1372]